MDLFSFAPQFFVSGHLQICKGWSSRYSPGWGHPHCCLAVLYVGEGSKREQCHVLSSLLGFNDFLCYPQANWTLLVLIPGLWVCVHPRTLWVSPANSPVKLGVYPTTTTPIGFYNQRFCDFISPCWNHGLCSLSHSPVVPPGLSMQIWDCMGSPATDLPAPVSQPLPPPPGPPATALL